MAAIWIDDDYWICPRHMRAVRLPASADSCWYAGCPTHRPAKPAVEEDSEANVAYDPQGLLARHQTRLERGERSLHSSPELASDESAMPHDGGAAASTEAVAAVEDAGTGAQAGEAAQQAAQAEASEADACQWKECENPARPASKYCSRKCSNKNARARYLKRQQNKPSTDKKVAGSDSGDRSAA